MRRCLLGMVRVRYCVLLDCCSYRNRPRFRTHRQRLDEDRAKPLAQRIVADASARQRIFPSIPDAEVAKAIADMYAIAIRESASNYGAPWWSMPPSVDAWVNQTSHPSTGLAERPVMGS
jgi:hypothetical protein